MASWQWMENIGKQLRPEAALDLFKGGKTGLEEWRRTGHGLTQMAGAGNGGFITMGASAINGYQNKGAFTGKSALQDFGMGKLAGTASQGVDYLSNAGQAASPVINSASTVVDEGAGAPGIGEVTDSAVGKGTGYTAASDSPSAWSKAWPYVASAAASTLKSDNSAQNQESQRQQNEYEKRKEANRRAWQEMMSKI